MLRAIIGTIAPRRHAPAAICCCVCSARTAPDRETGAGRRCPGTVSLRAQCEALTARYRTTIRMFRSTGNRAPGLRRERQLRSGCLAAVLLGTAALCGCTDKPWNNPHPPPPDERVTYCQRQHSRRLRRQRSNLPPAQRLPLTRQLRLQPQTGPLLYSKYLGKTARSLKPAYLTPNGPFSMACREPAFTT